MNRRHWPTALAVLAAAILVWYLLYSQALVRELRKDAEVHSRIVVRVYSGLSDPDMEPLATLLGLSGEIQRLRIPIVYADQDGVPAFWVNLPFEAAQGDTADMIRVMKYSDRLARQNPPLTEQGLGTIYFGDPPSVERLRWVPLLQVGALVALLATLASVIRHNVRTERERIWAAMARESAHQMATPLSSLAGWVEILRLPEEDREGMATLPAVAGEMEADLDRLEKVARRFEWIGRPVQTESVDVRTLLRLLERYVRVRLPQLGRGVSLEVDIPEGMPAVQGNAILLEWALENLVKNALDALAGAGGRICIEAEALGERRVEIRVTDDGPGVSATVRTTLFEPGVSTKKGGWGVGLSLARRIVEDVHAGKLRLEPSEKGARFVMQLPAVPEPADAGRLRGRGVGLYGGSA
ncbi:sensor histidine kinase [Longimicrobium terrae]|uniref:histidine kinase n=1 Tax=Longimicrobium terrae TaxID=1639882 RepID=A0A841GTZ4_9BACT|nr:HAMP domain-containing sensor histidine kinase [Longimicrobium terrae]MBB4635745.1 signal transduction histidine kinase [Longimicrobium terrae]MBB6070139.1 signal transduction histidine kinase [Longimicrobium terrae]NNC33040.1 HAMP domain-containing histidine kinase [Longimicrobium terrae]